MRELKTKDVFTMSKILKNMGLKLNGEGKTQQQFGIEIILTVAENLHLAEEEVNEFLANLNGMTKEEFEELPLEKTIEIFDEFRKQPVVANFLSRAGK